MPRQKLWKPYIIIASYVFCAAANPKFCLLLAGITLGNRAAAEADRGRRNRAAPQVDHRVAVGLDLALLGVFKYYAFFVRDWADLLDSFHLGAPLPLLTIALPIGVSFFTFRRSPTWWTSSAVTRARLDHRRRDLPQLLSASRCRADRAGQRSFPAKGHRGIRTRSRSGPASPGRPRRNQKVLIADYLARVWSTRSSRFPGLRRTGRPARGLRLRGADLLRLLRLHRHRDRAGPADGLHLPRRTSIGPTGRPASGTSGVAGTRPSPRFLRDYLYIPLGGSRGSRLFTYHNLMITMILGGLWHGAAWTFVLWGAFQGAATGHRART